MRLLTFLAEGAGGDSRVSRELPKIFLCLLYGISPTDGETHADFTTRHVTIPGWRSNNRTTATTLEGFLETVAERDRNKPALCSAQCSSVTLCGKAGRRDRCGVRKTGRPVFGRPASDSPAVLENGLFARRPYHFRQPARFFPETTPL